jgi:hypothetical protein
MFYSTCLFITAAALFLIGFRIYTSRRGTRITILKRYQSEYNGVIEITEDTSGEKRLIMNYATQGLSVEQPTIYESYWGVIAKQSAMLL